MSDKPEWFAAKRYGIGSSLPIAWQGWAVLIGFMVAITAATALIAYSRLAYFSVVGTLVALFLLICARTTRGGWRWRWGDPD
ncbi:MAG: hypothetical protein ABIO69_04005 [Sphingomicrobium sp.]